LVVFWPFIGTTHKGPGSAFRPLLQLDSDFDSDCTSSNMQPSAEPSVHARDILVNGFIAQTFSDQDGGARDYFTSLFRSSPNHDFLQDQGILYSRGAWHITRDDNGFLETKDFPQPVDFDVRKTQGTVVPQRQRAQVGYLVASYTPQLPIFFVHQNGGVGFSLSDILQGRDSGLSNGDEEAPLDEPILIFIRISWPTYADWTQEIQTRDRTYTRNPITRASFMKAVGRSVEKFFNTPVANGHVDPRWGIGVHGITQNDVKIIGAIHMSYVTWMPIIQLISHVGA